MKITLKRDYLLGLESVAMTDIVLNMFIFFFISFSLLYTFTKHQGIKITLPSAMTATSQKENVSIFITPSNEIIIDGKATRLSDLKSILEERLNRLKGSQEKTVVLKSDEKVNLGFVVKVMDIAREAQAEGVVISTVMKENVGR